MAKLPAFRDTIPIGQTNRGDLVHMSRAFRQYLQLISRDVSVQDGAAPGGSDFVMFPNYPREPQVCVSANYPQAEEQAAVTAQYGTGCGTVAFARY